MISALIGIPLFSAILAFFIKSDSLRRSLLLIAAIAHFAICVVTWFVTPQPMMNNWLVVESLEIIFLSLTSTLFLASAIYAQDYLKGALTDERADIEKGLLFRNAPEANFTGCLLLFLTMMTLVVVSRHIGILWVAVEATTLASAPLIYFHRHHRSLEATWKYLLICSVGIAIALLGNFFLVVAASSIPPDQSVMTFEVLRLHAAELNPVWLKAAFILLLVGYGTKMGLAPLHTWLPDAHSESPAIISALLSGALLNCAFLPILRMHSLCTEAGIGEMSSGLLIFMGLFSMGFAALFIFRQTDYKRMLAYSSVEHMGIIAFGIGIGGAAGTGAMLHAVNHSFTKALLFLISGNIVALYHTKSSQGVQGVIRALPISGALWLAGFLALSGSPPFGMFISEIKVIEGAINSQHYVEIAIFLALLIVVFVGMARVVLNMSQGTPNVPENNLRASTGEPLTSIVPPAILAAVILMLGVYVPPLLSENIVEALAQVGLR
jgi:hydrogenase-4 component F